MRLRSFVMKVAGVAMSVVVDVLVLGGVAVLVGAGLLYVHLSERVVGR